MTTRTKGNIIPTTLAITFAVSWMAYVTVEMWKISTDLAYLKGLVQFMIKQP